MSDVIKEQIDRLKEAILKYDRDYFENQNSDLEDPIYDQMMAELDRLEKQYPQYLTADSPTQKVGGKAVNTFTPVVHKIPMQSLGKVLNKDEFKTWFLGMVNSGVTEFQAELKMDGVSISLEYENGVLQLGSTRGDGITGEDVTLTAKRIPSIPNKVENSFTDEVRGEVYLKKSHLEKLNQILISQGKNPFKNVRNAASGLLRRKEVTKENEFLSFAAYFVRGDSFSDLSTYQDKMNFLEFFGFPTVSQLSNIVVRVEDGNVDKALKEFEDYFDKLAEERDNFDFDIDGVVIKANKEGDQKRLGTKTNVPNWAIAYKFPAQEGLTTLRAVEWTMGNKGNITPNARLGTPVNLVGAEVKNVTLHNLEELKRLGIMIGDHIVVARQGDVIPKVKRVLLELRTGIETEIQIPTHCPECGAPTVVKGAFLTCSAGSKCLYMNFAKVQNFIVSMEIEEFGDVKIKELLDVGLIEDVADLYDKQIIDFENGLTRVGKRMATKMYNNIQNSRDNDLWMVISGLTIDGVGKETAKDLANKYQSLSSFIDCTVDELVAVDGIAEVSAEKIVKWCKDPDNRKLVQKLIERNVGKMKEKVTSSNKLAGKVFATSGKISISRGELEKMIVENGGEFSGIKKGITHFIAGENCVQAKADKAAGLGAKIITGSEFFEMLK